ncbi:DNA cytosine methyltransferase [Agrobacterium pusense]|uniref:DNA cytosine methyltransferase n=1 Tax=Agrobacterium pusense TaxID=648995 RepID=UPI00156B1F02|nr:DNA cytosine methyltransferase [Agrobacterium pusense]QKJ94359.1 DNA cytosine methyltransferase [Agrobacterium pusense]
MRDKFKYYEFFAGVGMARAGLQDEWQCLYANDCDELKCSTYKKNWRGEVFDRRDVALVGADDLPDSADLAWASFPCQDLSQAGAKLGIGEAGGAVSTRSGAVWPFLEIIRHLGEEGRAPNLLALENVLGLLSANGGADFRALCSALSEIGYRFGAVVADASFFVPQSRPRVFIIAIRRELPLPAAFTTDIPQRPWHGQILLRAKASLPPEDVTNWVWWSPGAPPSKKQFELSEIIDVSGEAEWNTEEATDRLIGMMSPMQLGRLNEAKAAKQLAIGSLYLRMRPTGSGKNVQRAEVTFSETLGCLRTPKGGASRPRIVVVDGERVRTRLLSVREAALLMGLDKEFELPSTYHDCFRLIGDGVVPAVVRFLAERLFEPLAIHARSFAAAGGKLKESA